MQNAHLPAVRFAPRAYMGCGGWDLARAPETTASLDQDDWIPGRAATRRPLPRPRRMKGVDAAPQVTMGCGEETCETCASEMGCTKCKRIRKHAMNNQELQGARSLGQAAGLPDTSVLLVSGLAVAGLFYFATR